MNEERQSILELLKNRDVTFLGRIAAIILGLAFLAAGIFLSFQVSSFGGDAPVATGIVSGIESGVKGVKRAVLRFTTANGEQVETRDAFQMIWPRFEAGAAVQVRYHPDNLNSATIDIGKWLWLQPAAFFLGGLTCLGLGIFLPFLEKFKMSINNQEK